MRSCEKCKTLFEGMGKLCPECKHNLELEHTRKLVNGDKPERLSDEEKRRMIEERKRDKKFWWG